ncbi:hypothetical protein AB0C96_42315 [Streptomyces sp. NPDC048506]|uniref:hypothetical protein n=1 Tax=Streptomyces sp. NPDC048506 TaxID=3155028 RepID=UPI00344AB846
MAELRAVDGVWASARSVEVRAVSAGADGAERSMMVGDAGEIADLARLLEVHPTSPGFVCMCCGDVTFTVRGERGKVLGVLTLYLSSGLEWCGWDGQHELVHPEELGRWLAERRIMAA